MNRDIEKKLLNWKNSDKRKPIIINGARQVGKTWALKEFGKKEFKDCLYVNFDNIGALRNLFSDYEINRILRVLSAYFEVTITKDTLIIFDEIQEEPRAITSLKYFCEERPDIYVAAAGSLLGISSGYGTGFPVGKVDEINLYPLNFTEFLAGIGKEQLAEYVLSESWKDTTALKDILIDALRQYYYVGGMPEAVDYYAHTGDFTGVREIQKNILSNYSKDFAKHIPSNLLKKVDIVWNAIPSQLSKENKKLIYSALKPGGRAREFEDAIQWLVDAGLVHKTIRVNALNKPLKFYEDFNAFKLFMVDLGLLGAMVNVKPKEIIVENKLFSEYKGAFTEQFVLQQLISMGIKPYYYSNTSSTLELDFAAESEVVYPIEVKASENLKSKSLKTALNKYTGLKGIRFSLSDYRDQDYLINIPLYLVQAWAKNI